MDNLKAIIQPTRHNVNDKTKTHTTKQPQTLTLLLSITLCGDVASNPGPKYSSTFPCGYCQEQTNFDTRIIACNECDMWYHKSCLDMGTQTYDNLDDNSIVWICPHCDVPNYEGSFFKSYELDTFNQFSILAGNNSESQNVISSPTPIFEPMFTSSPRKGSDGNSYLDDRPNQSVPSPSMLPQHTNNNVSFIPMSETNSNNLQNSTLNFSSHLTQLPKQQNLRTLVVNCQSITNKQAQLQTTVDYTNPDLIFGTESHLDSSYSDAEIFPPGYTIYRKDRNAHEEVCFWL